MTFDITLPGFEELMAESKERDFVKEIKISPRRFIQLRRWAHERAEREGPASTIPFPHDGFEGLPVRVTPRVPDDEAWCFNSEGQLIKTIKLGENKQ